MFAYDAMRLVSILLHLLSFILFYSKIHYVCTKIYKDHIIREKKRIENKRIQ